MLDQTKLLYICNFLLALQSIDAIIDIEEEEEKNVTLLSFFFALHMYVYMACLLMIQDKYYDDRPLLLSWSFICFPR